METGAIVAVTTHGGAVADTATIKETVIEAGVAVAELLTAEPPEGKYAMHPGGVEEVVADKGYHSNQAAVSLGRLVARTYIAEPDRGTRDWDGKQAEREAVYGNRRRIRGERGKRMQRQRGEKIEPELRTSVRYGRYGSAIRPRHRECAQETADPGGGVRNLALLLPDDVWSGQATDRF